MAAVEDLRFFSDEANHEDLLGPEGQEEACEPLRLHDAASIGDAASIEALATQHAPLDTCNRSGWAPLHLAAAGGHHGAASVLLAHGARVDVRSRCPRSFDGCTPLHVAVAARDTRMVGVLLGAGADPDHRDDCGYTALHLACELGESDIVKRLLMAGARHDTLVGDDTALGVALRHSRMTTVGLLRQVGAKT